MDGEGKRRDEYIERNHVKGIRVHRRQQGPRLSRDSHVVSPPCNMGLGTGRNDGDVWPLCRLEQQGHGPRPTSPTNMDNLELHRLLGF